MPGKPVTYDGVEYESYRALAKAYGIDERRVRARLSSGWSLPDAVETTIGEKVTNGIPIEYEGVAYPSLKNMAEQLGFPRSILQHAYYRTRDIHEAVEYCREYNKRDMTVWGKTYRSISEAALVFGISHVHLSKAVHEGKTLQEAVKKALETESILFEGKRYERFTDLCATFRIQPANVYLRLELGMELGDALIRPIKRNGNRNSIFYQGKEYESQIALCREYGISVLCVREQTKTNPITFLDSFEVLEKLKKKLGMELGEMMNYIPHCRIRGKNYKTTAEFVRQFGITTASFYSYKHRSEHKDVFAVLKEMQAETRTAYLVEGKRMLREEALKLGYSDYTIGKFPKTELPKYPALAGFDFDTECYDGEKLYYEILNEKLEELEQKKNQEEGLDMRME